jgi:hypothetical protein
MKKHISQAAIDAVAAQWLSAFNDAEIATDPKLEQYFRGKQVAITDVFATMTNQTWVEADMMLMRRSQKL